MKTIEVAYHAQLREARGLDKETIASDVSNARALYLELQEKYQLALPVEAMKVAVNDELVGWDHPLSEGDRVALLPPVAGG